MNFDCTAYKQRICINLGFGEFFLDSEISSDNQRDCSLCSSMLGKVNKVGYAHCIVSYNSSSVEDTVKLVQRAVKGYYEENIQVLPSSVRVSKFL